MHTDSHLIFESYAADYRIETLCRLIRCIPEDNVIIFGDEKPELRDGAYVYRHSVPRDMAARTIEDVIYVIDTIVEEFGVSRVQLYGKLYKKLKRAWGQSDSALFKINKIMNYFFPKEAAKYKSMQENPDDAHLYDL